MSASFVLELMFRSMSAQDMMSITTEFQREMERVRWLFGENHLLVWYG